MAQANGRLTGTEKRVEVPAEALTGVSAEVGELVREIDGLDRAAISGLGDDAFRALMDRRETLTRTLALTATRTRDDTDAKLTILCRRLREDAGPGDDIRTVTYMLAESVRDASSSQTSR